MTTRSDSSTKNDPETSSSQTASTPEVYRNQVTMTTVPLPLQPLQATVGHLTSPFTLKPFLLQPPLGFSAPSGRLSQAAQRAETQSARRAVVPPMTPQPLHIQGLTQHWQPRRITAAPVARLQSYHCCSFCEVLSLMRNPIITMSTAATVCLGVMRWAPLFETFWSLGEER